MVPTDEDATTLDPEHAGALLYPGSSTVVQRANAKRLGPQPNATMTQEVDGAPASAISRHMCSATRIEQCIPSINASWLHDARR